MEVSARPPPPRVWCLASMPARPRAQPSNGSLAYVAAANEANYAAMAAADPRAIYLMQVR